MNKLHERLKRLRDRLEDMEGKWKPFGFGILRPSPAAEVSLATWELAEDACEPHFGQWDGLHRPRRWLDMTPDGTYCIQWWGDAEGVEAFKKWADDVQVALRRSSTTVPKLFVPPVRPVPPSWVYSFGPSPWKPPSGYYWTLNAFSMLAIQNPHITLTKERVALTIDTKNPANVNVIPTRQRSLRDDDAHDNGPVTISYLETEEDALTVGLRVLAQLITNEIPPIYVENDVIFLKGKAVTGVSSLTAQAVGMLVAANGDWVKGEEIRRRLKLPEKIRLDRIFARLPPRVKNLIESEPFTGRRIRSTAARANRRHT